MKWMKLSDKEKIAFTILTLVFGWLVIFIYYQQYNIEQDRILSIDETKKMLSMYSVLPDSILVKTNKLLLAKNSPDHGKKKSRKKRKHTKKLLPNSIDINSAPLDSLKMLPKIGRKTAQAIIDYREKHGGFQSLLEIMRVKGIRNKTYAKILPYLKPIKGMEEKEMYKAAMGKNKKKKISGKININTADMTLLESLPGIGPSMAERIIDYREEHGKFEKIEDIMKVKGIGKGKFSKLKKYIVTK